MVVAGTTLSNVYGTATYGGTATLTATLTQGFTFFPGAYPMASQQVKSALGGKVVGMVPTNSSGVATLPGISISGYGAGTYSGASGVVASFAGNSTYGGTTGTGTLTVSPAPTTLISLYGTESYGGQVTLTATLQRFTHVLHTRIIR